MTTVEILQKLKSLKRYDRELAGDEEEGYWIKDTEDKSGAWVDSADLDNIIKDLEQCIKKSS